MVALWPIKTEVSHHYITQPHILRHVGNITWFCIPFLYGRTRDKTGQNLFEYGTGQNVWEFGAGKNLWELGAGQNLWEYGNGQNNIFGPQKADGPV